MNRTIFLLVSARQSCRDLDLTLASILSQVGDFAIDLKVQDAGSDDGTDALLADWQGRIARKEVGTDCDGVRVSVDRRALATTGAQVEAGLTGRGAGSNDFLSWLEAGACLKPGALAYVARVADQFDSSQVSWVGMSTGDDPKYPEAWASPSAVIKAGAACGSHWPCLENAGVFFRRWLWDSIGPDRGIAGLTHGVGWQIWRQFAARASLNQASQPLAERPTPNKVARAALEEEISKLCPKARRRKALSALSDGDLTYRVLAPTGVGDGLHVLRRSAAKRKKSPLGPPPVGGESPSHVLHKGAQVDPGDIAALEANIDIRDNIAVYDADWQYPAITEQHAFHQMRRLGRVPDGATYVAFPWATLIDKLHTDSADKRLYVTALRRLKARLPRDGIRVTVCQHIKMRDYMDLFKSCGITHIFWSHATEADAGRRHPEIRPFPLYPVQRPAEADLGEDRPYLFSFIGAKANQYYLTQARTWILEDLAKAPGGLIIGRDSWHYNKVVYDGQIKKRASTKDASKLVNQSASEEFKTSLARSVFSLCPSGTGPNSIRLWESLGAGAIPVVLADGLALPGAQALWKAGALRVPETQDAIREIPAQLAEIAQDPARLAAMGKAMAQLWRLYGPDTFITDIQAFLHAHAGRRYLFPDDDTAIAGDSGGIDTPQTATSLLRRHAADLLLALMASPPDPQKVQTALADAQVQTAYDLLPQEDAARRHHEQVAALATQRHGAPALDRRAAITVHLFPGHGHRTPLAYPAFQQCLEDRLRLVEEPENADVIMTGFNVDFKKALSDLVRIKSARPTQAHVVLSEEPLWDSVWSGDFTRRDHRIEAKGEALAYTFLNHQNSDIFAFDKLPYFILTEDHYALRYVLWLQRFAQVTPQEMLTRWAQAPVRAAFVAETRETEAYARTWPEANVYGLSVYRTDIARTMEGEDVLRIGRGWTDETGPRQKLADWHLDKLETTMDRCRVLSAYENTHQRSYISEKIFDAFVAGAIGTYYADDQHRILDLVPQAAMINTFGMDSATAKAKIETFAPDKAFAEAWLQTAARLCALFSDPVAIAQERKRVVDAICQDVMGLV